MTLSEWGESDYNTFGYYIDSTDEENNKIIEENANLLSDFPYTDFIWDVPEGISIEMLSEKNLKTIYNESNYNAIGRAFGYFMKEYHPYDYNNLNTYAKNLFEEQQSVLNNMISSYSNIEPVTPAFFVDIDSLLVSKDNEGFYTVAFGVEYYKDGNFEPIILVFDGISKNYYILDSDSVNLDSDYGRGIVTFKVKGSFAVEFFVYPLEDE